MQREGYGESFTRLECNAIETDKLAHGTGDAAAEEPGVEMHHFLTKAASRVRNFDSELYGTIAFHLSHVDVKGPIFKRCVAQSVADGVRRPAVIEWVYVLGSLP